MVSGYLNRKIRDRSAIARDLARSANGGYASSSVIADSLDVVFAVLVYDLETAEATIDYVSSQSWKLTGYWPNELKGKNIEILFDLPPGESALTTLLEGLRNNGYTESSVLIRRKNGTSFACHLLADRAETSTSNKRVTYHTFFAETDPPLSHQASHPF